MTPWPRGDAVRNRTPPCSRRSVANLRRREACIVLGRASRRSRHSAASVPNRSRRAAPSTGRATARPADRDGSRLGELPMREACRPSTMTSAGAANLEVNAMNTTRLEILDRSVEKAHIWINEVAQELGTEDVHEAYRVLRAFLQALRDHLSVDEAAQLAPRSCQSSCAASSTKDGIPAARRRVPAISTASSRGSPGRHGSRERPKRRLRPPAPSGCSSVTSPWVRV